ncbi:MAG: 3-keto-disaccharide hydrolase [Thermoguttaceae bacterium]
MKRKNACPISLCIAAVILLLPASCLTAAELKRVDTADSVPSDAVVLFDGGATDAFLSVDGSPCKWPVVDGAMVAKDTFIVSKLHFRDAQIHVEFAIPNDGQRGGNAGNSGLYIHGLFEMQIINCFTTGAQPKGTIGAVYGLSPPLVNASRQPGQWQTYDILYTGPRRNKEGEVDKPGAITAMLNGVLVQYNTPVTKSASQYNPLIYQTTPYTDKILASLRRTDAGPLFLQFHHSPVKFRNIWIRVLK